MGGESGERLRHDLAGRPAPGASTDGGRAPLVALQTPQMTYLGHKAARCATRYAVSAVPLIALPAAQWHAQCYIECDVHWGRVVRKEITVSITSAYSDVPLQLLPLVIRT